MFQKTKNQNIHKLIMEQINDVENCLVKFESFIRAACTPNVNTQTLCALSEEVSEQESVADISLRRMIDSLSGSAFLPSSREEIISIATSCDRVANKCEAFSQIVILQQLKLPVEYAESMLEIASITKVQFSLLKESISCLFSNFGAFLKDHSILDQIREEESKVDDIEKMLYKKTFALDLGLAERMQISNLVEHICAVSDVIENIADKIQIMLVTRKA